MDVSECIFNANYVTQDALTFFVICGQLSRQSTVVVVQRMVLGVVGDSTYIAGITVGMSVLLISSVSFMDIGVSVSRSIDLYNGGMAYVPHE